MVREKEKDTKRCTARKRQTLIVRYKTGLEDPHTELTDRIVHR